MLLVSSIGSGISLTVLGTYSYLHVCGVAVQPYSWIAVSSFASMLFLASCGIIPLPFVVIAEVMPEKVNACSINNYLKFSDCLCCATDSQYWSDRLSVLFVDYGFWNGENISHCYGHDRTARMHIYVCNLLFCRCSICFGCVARNEGQKLH